MGNTRKTTYFDLRRRKHWVVVVQTQRCPAADFVVAAVVESPRSPRTWWMKYKKGEGKDRGDESLNNDDVTLYTVLRASKYGRGNISYQPTDCFAFVFIIIE